MSCKALGLNVNEYLVDVITKFSSGWKLSRIGELVPDAWAAARAKSAPANPPTQPVAAASGTSSPVCITSAAPPGGLSMGGLPRRSYPSGARTVTGRSGRRAATTTSSSLPT